MKKTTWLVVECLSRSISTIKVKQTNRKTPGQLSMVVVYLQQEDCCEFMTILS